MAAPGAQQVKLPCGMQASRIRVLGAPLPIQRPANPPGKAAEDGPSTWVSATHVEDSDTVLGS